MVKRTQRGLHPVQAEAMRKEVRSSAARSANGRRKCRSARRPYLGCDVLNHALLLMDMQLTAAIDAVPYERPPRSGGLES